MEITSSEFSEWQEFFRLEPPADFKREREAASICYYIAKSLGGAKKVTIEDFLLEYKAPEKQDARSLKAKVGAWLTSVKHGMEGTK